MGTAASPRLSPGDGHRTVSATRGHVGTQEGPELQMSNEKPKTESCKIFLHFYVLTTKQIFSYKYWKPNKAQRWAALAPGRGSQPVCGHGGQGLGRLDPHPAPSQRGPQAEPCSASLRYSLGTMVAFIPQGSGEHEVTALR